MLLVLYEGRDEVSVGPDTASSLAGLGVTSLAILRHGATVGIVLEGWAFVPERSATRAVQFLSEHTASMRMLTQVLHMAVTPAVQS
jgi:hypothetical protein